MLYTNIQRYICNKQLKRIVKYQSGWNKYNYGLINVITLSILDIVQDKYYFPNHGLIKYDMHQVSMYLMPYLDLILEQIPTYITLSLWIEIRSHGILTLNLQFDNNYRSRHIMQTIFNNVKQYEKLFV